MKQQYVMVVVSLTASNITGTVLTAPMTAGYGKLNIFVAFAG